MKIFYLLSMIALFVVLYYDNVNFEGEDVKSTYSEYSQLSNFSKYNYPTSFDNWVISDQYATENDFAGLRDALNRVSKSGDRKISIHFTKLTTVPVKAFYKRGYNASALNKLKLPYVTNINEGAFRGCVSLDELHTPSLTTIEKEAFKDCVSLKTIGLSKVMVVESGAFDNCVSIDSLRLDMIVAVNSGAFKNMGNLKWVSLPEVEFVASDSFTGCTALDSISIATNTELLRFLYDFSSQNTSTMSLVLGSDNFHLIEGELLKAPVGKDKYKEYFFKKIDVL